MTFPKLLALGTLLALLVGCSSEPRGTLSGTVTNGGTPVTKVMVLFENASVGQSINVSVDETGAFEAMSEGKPGIPPGTYQVAVRPDAFSPANEPPPLVESGANSKSEASEAIPRKYQNPATSDIAVEIVEGENPPLVIDLSK